RLPPAAVPAHALTPGTVVAGRRVAGPVRRGEALTDVRLVGAGLAAGLSRSGSVAVSVRLDDPAVAGLLRPGDRVDVLAAPGTDSAAPAPAPAPAPGPVPAALGRVGETGGTPEVTSGSAGQATVIASDVMVLAASPTDSDQAGGGLLVVAVPMPVARRLAGVSPENRLTVALRPP
ncbi:MAG TPA: RcpC/CpaB family pilus assembly protein, partial [Mycobacteriales bacterium]